MFSKTKTLKSATNRTTSATHSLNEILQLEAERERQERLAQAKRKEDAEQAAINALVAQREENLRLEGIREGSRQGEIERARMLAENEIHLARQLAELTRVQSEQAHERDLAVLQNDLSKRRLKRPLGVALIACAGALGVAGYALTRPKAAQVVPQVQVAPTGIQVAPTVTAPMVPQVIETTTPATPTTTATTTNAPKPKPSSPKPDPCAVYRQIRGENPADPRLFDPTNPCLE